MDIPTFEDKGNVIGKEGVEEELEKKKEREDENEDGEVREEEKVESPGQKQGTGFSPHIGFFNSLQREVYYYADEKIVIEEGLDSFAGMIWPAALAVCHHLDSHRQEINLVDKAVLELGAGTGLVSVVAALLGAWVTATDLPVVLNNLTANVSRNTRGRCRHTPQVAALVWGHDLETTYPTSVYRYDYVLAADVVYHHDFLNELLDTMKHFCRPGTTLIWANKVRFETDLKFMEDFQKTFHTSLLVEDGELKIFMATCKDEEEDVVESELWREEEVKEEDEDEEETKQHTEEELDSAEELRISEAQRGGDEGLNEPDEITTECDECKEDEQEVAEVTEQAGCQPTVLQPSGDPAWVPSTRNSFGKDIYHYAGHDIVIQESIDYFGAVMWPGALALCSFLDNNRQMVDVRGKEVLELGAGTGLVTIVASLLGASVTATDLPEVLSNLKANVMRNTRGRCRHTPQVAALIWGHDLETTYPTSVYRYDYVLAADVVYHHDFLNELLDTMKHFCRPGTTLIWANKVRFEGDLKFMEDFQKTFHTSLLAEDGDMRIFMATGRE
ncbi:uncharacterized protein LOC130518093 [Takifugu flavidus]|uniref:uncharacterized protein LOC130518093 n=1 Tax=Takifugu flavidus TaxID=433684 RepID=UPI00254468E5|nr:uncharacterized protein LOC130518093 [Takifugu flavidus]XP_056876430.1 uncharacterized protein LOC130518093 [Takifugu flavidus]